MFRELQIPARSIFTGNYRLFYYFRNKAFYDAIAEKEVFSHLQAGATTVLYAPTWKDSDEATTFFSAMPAILEGLPKSWNLIVKGHPLLETNNPERYYHIAALAEKRPNTIVLSEFPLIYPLLARVDLYLGDYSSVGYDMLAFEKPMFFIVHPHLPRGRLHACGVVLENPRDLLREYEKGRDFTKEQRALYKWAFQVPPHVGTLQAPVFEDLAALYYPPATAESIRNQIRQLC
jgi:CDP-glycerol glycerophosphotransferase (TagB/SpsB family)